VARQKPVLFRRVFKVLGVVLSAPCQSWQARRPLININLRRCNNMMTRHRVLQAPCRTRGCCWAPSRSFLTPSWRLPRSSTSCPRSVARALLPALDLRRILPASDGSCLVHSQVAPERSSNLSVLHGLGRIPPQIPFPQQLPPPTMHHSGGVWPLDPPSHSPLRRTPLPSPHAAKPLRHIPHAPPSPSCCRRRWRL
jgi:hypothetical protein